MASTTARGISVIDGRAFRTRDKSCVSIVGGKSMHSAKEIGNAVLKLY